jgi:hypothetical protein
MMSQPQCDTGADKPSSCLHIFFAYVLGGGLLFFLMVVLTYIAIHKFAPVLAKRFDTASVQTAGAAIPLLVLIAAAFGVFINITLGYVTTRVRKKMFWNVASFFIMLAYPILFTYLLFVYS